MSVRIYQLSKEIGKENAELIELLRERGYEVKSASSTIDNISAESLREEFAPKKTNDAEVKKEIEETPVEAPKKPAGSAVVRSKEDVERERREREEEEERKREAQVTPPAPTKPDTKAPPSLPKMPVKRASSMPSPSIPKAESNQPSGPTLRTDIKEEPKVEEESKVSEQKGSASLRPPSIKKGPQSIAPPRSAPKVMVPPVAAKPSKAEDEEDKTPQDKEQPEEGVVEASTEQDTSGLRTLQVKTPIVVRDFAIQVGKKPFQLISELMELGIFASMNTAIDEDVAKNIAKNHGFALEVRHRGEGAAKEEEKPKDQAKKENLSERPPIVCILGHVDHGKTTLLDTIRKANVVAGEAGGITQHVGAYQIEHSGKKITFIDTPGHAAFSNMRARGAGVTDLAILIVAADDGFMPQTDEALTHAQRAGVPIIVAINKIDAPGANLDKVKRQMQERELTPEDWGGETLCAEISALKGEGIDGLLDQVILQAEVTETIVADPKGAIDGIVLEAQKELGRGSTASVIVRNGTLKTGMALVCGENYCRVRQLISDQGKPVREAPPSTPVNIVGWSGPPASGDLIKEVKNERMAKKEAEANELERKKLEAAEKQDSGASSIDDLFAAIEKNQKKTFRVVVKADVYGTAEALATSLLNIKSDKIDLDVVDMGVGAVTRNDVTMASASGSCVVAFNVGLENGINSRAKHEGINIIQGSIIYEVIDAVKDSMADLIEPELEENKIGAAEVRQVFPLGKSWVAGCMVTEGSVRRGAISRMQRKGKQVAEAKIETLKRFKDDANEVRAGYECGIQMQGVNSYEEGDIIEVFEIIKIKPEL